MAPNTFENVRFNPFNSEDILRVSDSSDLDVKL